MAKIELDPLPADPLRIVHKPKAHLQLGNADTFRQRRFDTSGIGVFILRRLVPVIFQLMTLWYPTVTFADKANKERRNAQRAAAGDLFEADLHRLAVVRILFGNPPAQVNLAKYHLAFKALLSKQGKNAGQ